MLSDENKLQLKIIDKLTQEYVGEVVLMKLDAEMPELGIQILQKYHGQGIGTRVMNLFVVKIRSDNHISQRLFEKMGVVKIGEEGKEYAELMCGFMRDVGKEKFEEIVEDDFENTQIYTLCYKLTL